MEDKNIYKTLMNIYEGPILEEIGELKTVMENQHDQMILRAVQQIGIEIDKESLVQAINNDRRRYEAAYRKGYTDCEEHYKELLSHIRELATLKGRDEECC